VPEVSIYSGVPPRHPPALVRMSTSPKSCGKKRFFELHGFKNILTRLQGLSRFVQIRLMPLGCGLEACLCSGMRFRVSDFGFREYFSQTPEPDAGISKSTPTPNPPAQNPNPHHRVCTSTPQHGISDVKP